MRTPTPPFILSALRSQSGQQSLRKAIFVFTCCQLVIIPRSTFPLKGDQCNMHHHPTHVLRPKVICNPCRTHETTRHCMNFRTYVTLRRSAGHMNTMFLSNNTIGVRKMIGGKRKRHEKECGMENTQKHDEFHNHNTVSPQNL